MMPKRFLLGTMSAALILAVLVTGCINLGEGTRRRPRLYVLTALASDADHVASARAASMTIGVGPLVFPDYLDRLQLVTRDGDNEIIAAPFSNWAEPLKQNTLRVLVDNLATITASGGVYRYPWWVVSTPQFQLQMEIDRFDAVRNENAFLIVSWAWLDKNGKPVVPRKRLVLQQPVDGDSDEAVVTAMSGLLLTFSRTAAAQLAGLTI
jgi:uncharacterized protein